MLQTLLTTHRSNLPGRARLLLTAAVFFGLVACAEDSDPVREAGETTSRITPNLWIWRANHLGRSHYAFGLFDLRNDPAALIVGHVPWASNIPSSFYAFEVRELEDTMHLESFGSFQPHANCIQGDFEFIVAKCEADSEYELCGTLLDQEAGSAVKMRSFSSFHVVIPQDWKWKYSADGTMGEDLVDHIDLSPMLDRMADASYKDQRIRSTSRFLRGAFNVRAGLSSRTEETKVSRRNCVDSERGIANALTGRDNSQFISKELP